MRRLIRVPTGMLLAALALVLLTACGRDTRSVQASEVFTADSLADLAMNSDAVIKGTVVKVEPGRLVGDEEPVQLTQVSVSVERVLLGAVSGDVILLEEGFGIPRESSSVGDSGIFFVHLKDEKTDQPYYRLVSSQGRFVEADGKVTASNDDLDWVKELESLTPTAFEAEVAEAVSLAGGGIARS